jgi:hypothetical protein
MDVASHRFLDMCYSIQLEIFSCLEGSEIKTMQAACADLATTCDVNLSTPGRGLLGDLNAIGHRPSSVTLHEAVQLPSLSNKEAFDVAYSQALSLGCSMASMLCAEDALGRTPLMLAVRTEKHETMKWFLQQGAPVDKGNTQNGWSPLLLASWKADMAAMEILIAHGADVDCHCEGESGFTPLVAAAAREALNACEILLAAGASRDKSEHVLKCSTNPFKKDIIQFLRNVSARPWSIDCIKRFLLLKCKELELKIRA